MADITFRLDAKLDGVNWTNITSDVIRGSVRHRHGIDGNTPLDVVAGSGELTFRLRNDASGSRPVGYYSPGHANVRTGWDYGVLVRVVYNDGSDRQRWTGKIAEINPEPNPKGPRWVSVVAYDYQHDLVEAEVRNISPQVGQLESTLIGVVLDAVPAAAQPLSRSIATGLDSFPFVFDQIGDGIKAVGALNDVVRSAFGIYYTSVTGVGTYKTRQTRFTSASIATLTDSEIDGFAGPTSREGSYNVVRVTYHPKHTTAGIVLWSYTGATPQVVRAGETISVWTPYRDPDQTGIEIGASSITAPVSGTDYIANEFDDGSGTVLTANLTVTSDRYTTGTAWQIQNTGSTDAYLTTWQIRGTGIFDDAEQTVESRSTQAYGERVLNLDLKYQNDRHVAYGMATLVREQRENPTTLPREVRFTGNRTTTLRALAMTAEIGDIVTVSNAMTGVSGATCSIQSIACEYDRAGSLRVTFGLAPTSALTTPSVPTGLAVANTSDSELTPSWTNTDATAETEVYVDGVLATIATPTATSATVGSLTRATNYTVTVKHVKYALLRSSATSGVVGRPTVTATGGTVSTFNSGGVDYKKHVFTTSSNLVVTGRGRYSRFLENGGAGGGGSDRTTRAGGGGAGGYYELQIDDDEPTGTHAVVIGAGGAGGISGNNTGSDGGQTTYRGSGPVVSGGGGSLTGGAAHNGAGGALGGGGSGDGGLGGSSGAVFNGGNGSTTGWTVTSPGGGGAGAGGAGGAGVDDSSSGGAKGAAYSPATIGGSYGQGGKGGGSGESPAVGAANTGNGGDGTIAATNGVFVNGKAGGSGIAIFWYPI